MFDVDDGVVILAVTLSSGNLAAYEILESKLSGRSYHGQTQRGRIIEDGRLLAVKSDGDWYNRLPSRASWVHRFTDKKVIERLESLRVVND